MDILQLFRDLFAGLAQLIVGQWISVVQWVDANPNGAIVAVGDVFPLAFAWLASRWSRKVHMHCGMRKAISYAFVGTAKSEYYRRGDQGLPHKLGFTDQVELALFPASVYFPWERALMADSQCRLVAARDGLTVEFLKQHISSSEKVKFLGNPMMDNLQQSGALDFLRQHLPARFIALLPGSRSPEVNANWNLLLRAACSVSTVFSEKVFFLAPLVPTVDPYPFCETLTMSGWQLFTINMDNSEPSMINREQKCHKITDLVAESSSWPVSKGIPILLYRKAHVFIILMRGGFNDALHWAEAAIAMAGTATEQMVGMGKPVFTIGGSGPQFTERFAEAQSRLLGNSVILCPDCSSLAVNLERIMSNKDFLNEVCLNGYKRMGRPGAAKQIAQEIQTSVLCQY